MDPFGINPKFVRLRVLASEERCEQVTGIISDALEQFGFELLEATPPRKRRPPEEQLSVSYLTCVKDEVSEEDEE